MTIDERIPVLKGWITLTDAAERLGLARQYVHRMMRDGDFKTIRRVSDKFYVVKEDEIAKMLTKRTVATGVAS